MAGYDTLIRLGLIGVGFAFTGCASSPAQPSGRQVFETHCASCHGVRGAGDGPVAASLNVPVPNLRGLDARYGGNFPADAIASYIDGRNLPAAHGARTMPVWGAVFETTERVVPGAEQPEQRISAIVDYLRLLQER